MCPLPLLLSSLIPSPAWAAGTALDGVGFIRSHLLGQGEFSGLDILDIIVLVVLAAVILQFLRGRRRDEMRGPVRPDSGPRPPADHENLEARQARARAAWDRLAGGQASAPRPAAPMGGSAGGFDEQEFLSGAKAVFGRILAALGRGDAADLDQFAGPEAVAQLMAQGPHGASPEIVLLEAQVQDRREEGGLERVRVRYRALLRAGGEQAAPDERRTLWRFARRAGDPASHWKLEAVEDPRYNAPA
jgi:predicted lipid-binding transport protein (Tim44 family)